MSKRTSIFPKLVTEILGKHIQGSLLIAVALGVPFYSCGGAAIPLSERGPVKIVVYNIQGQ